MEVNNQRNLYPIDPDKHQTHKLPMKALRIIPLAIAILVVVGMIVYFLCYGKSSNDFKDLSQQVQSAQTTYPVESIPSDTAPIDPTAETQEAKKDMLAHYADLYEQNPDFYGWLQIDDTVIDYPVMRSVEEPEKYLHANFMAEYSYPGIPFVDYQCSNDSDNILIYGHNMLDGSMFRSLIKYENQSYWEAHPTIMYSDLYGEYEYEVLAAFYDRVYKKSETCFKFYQFIDAESELDFDDAISRFKEKSIYDTGVDAEYGDQLITLVTCAYHVENGRFVVVARRSAN